MEDTPLDLTMQVVDGRGPIAIKIFARTVGGDKLRQKTRWSIRRWKTKRIC
jgi:hypothetical protein